MTRPLQGRTAVVAGASRGIGLAIADSLEAAGAHVVRLARSLSDASSDSRQDFRCDITDASAVGRVAKAVLDARGAPDILVNNAGSFLVRPLVETTPSEFAGQVAGNLSGPFLVARAFLAAMVQRGSGLIVTIGSIADHRAFPGNAAYAAAKHGVRGLHEALVSELAGTGVRACLVSPGPVDTTLWDSVDTSGPGFTPRSEMLRAEDVAETVLFLATRPAGVHVRELHIEPARR